MGDGAQADRDDDGPMRAVDPACGCATACPMCGSTAPAIYVHGHSQCADCKVNIDPCCGGAPIDAGA